jgi:nucleotide-binding universal stress UspA family protein
MPAMMEAFRRRNAMRPSLLVPLDLGSEDPPELKFAADLGRALSAELVLLHVIDYVPTLLPVDLPGGYPLPQLEIVNEAAGKKLARIAEKLAPLHARTVIAVGAAAEQIVGVAKREKVSQIVMGSHSHRAIARLVLGSVADRVAHTATCPVTIVRETKH